MTDNEKSAFRKGWLSGVEATLPIKVKIQKTVTTDINNTELYADKNGIYTPAEGYTGFNRVVVDVPDSGGGGGGGDDPSPINSGQDIFEYNELIECVMPEIHTCTEVMFANINIINVKLCTIEEVT